MLDFRVSTFLTLCREGSYTKTAEELCITQPTVTQHIQALEARYGVKLVTYQGRKLTVTPEGELLRRAAVAAAAQDRQLQEKMRTISRKRSLLRLGATLTVGEFVLPPALGELCRASGTEVSLTVGNTSLLLEKLRGGELDCAFVEGYFDESQFASRVLLSDDFIPVCGPDYPFPAPPRVLADLLREPLLLREPGSGTREVLERVLFERGRSVEDFQKSHCVGNLNVIKFLCAENVGVSFLYRSAAKEALAGGRLRELRLEDFHVRHEYCFVTLAQSAFTEEHEALFRFVRETLCPGESGEF